MLSKFLYYIDVYAQNIYFSVDKKKHTSTFIGGLFTLVISCALICLFVAQIVELCAQEKITKILNEVWTQEIPSYEINKRDFPFGIKIIDNSLNATVSFANYLTLGIYHVQTEYRTSIGSKLCEQADFNGGFSDIEQMVCPIDYIANINRDNYLEITLAKCFQDSNCRTSEEINNFLTSRNLSLIFTYRNGLFDYNQDTNDDFVYYFANETFHLPSERHSVGALTFEINELNKDKNVMIYRTTKNYSLQILDVYSEEEEMISNDLLTIRIRLSNKRKILLLRSYKLIESLSTIGGFGSFLKFLGFLCSFIFQKTKRNVSILNSVFDFTSFNTGGETKILEKKSSIGIRLDQSSSDKVKLTDIKTDIKTSELIPSLKNTNMEFYSNKFAAGYNSFNPFYRKNSYISSKDNLEIKLKKLIIEKNNKKISVARLISFSTFEIIQLYLRCNISKYFKKKKVFYNMKINEMLGLLNISSYFEKCIQLDKLSYIVLGKAQNNVISLLSREMIQNSIYHAGQVSTDIEFKKEKAVMNYANKIRNPEYNFTFIDKRILKLLDNVNI